MQKQSSSQARQSSESRKKMGETTLNMSKVESNLVLQMPKNQDSSLSRKNLRNASPSPKVAQSANKCIKIVQLLYLNMQIGAKMYTSDTYQSFVRRNNELKTSNWLLPQMRNNIVHIMAIDDEKVLAFLPISKITPVQEETESNLEGKKPKKASKNVSEDVEMDVEGTPNSCNKRDLVHKLKDLQDDQVYYLVYTRTKTANELNKEQMELEGLRSPATGSGSKRVPLTPRKRMADILQRQGLKISETYEKGQRARGAKKPLFCPFIECLRDFQETGNLKTHLRIHTGERPFACPFDDCDKRFITKGHLKTHELIHTGAKPFVCDVCGKSYSRTGRLKIHKRTHVGEKPFMCDFPGCGKRFTEKGNLKTHIRIHNGEKPFACNFEGCGRMFTTHGHLSDHFRRHTGERPFKCEECDQSFMRSSTLKIHMRRHTGEKPFGCNCCGKKFAESGNLRTHLKTHEKKINALPDSSLNDKNFSSAAILATMESSKLIQPQERKESKPKMSSSKKQKPTKTTLTSLFNSIAFEEAETSKGALVAKRQKFEQNKKNKQNKLQKVQKQQSESCTPSARLVIEPQNSEMTFAEPKKFLAMPAGASVSVVGEAGINGNLKKSAVSSLAENRLTKANEKQTIRMENLNNRQHMVLRNTAMGSETEPRAKESYIASTISDPSDVQMQLKVFNDCLINENSNQWKRVAQTSEYPKEAAENSNTNYHENISAGNHHDLIKVSRASSSHKQQLLLNENAEPQTPMSHLLAQHQANEQNLYIHYNALNQMATKLDHKQIMRGAKDISPQCASSPQIKFDQFSPRLTRLQNMQQIQNQPLIQPHPIINNLTTSEMISKLIPHQGYAEAFNSHERTPRDMITPSNYLMQQPNYSEQRCRTDHKTQFKAMRTDSQLFEDQQSTCYLNQQTSVNTATFQQNSITNKTEYQQSILGGEKCSVKKGGEDHLSMPSFMKKNMSLNSNFQMKTPNEGAMTRSVAKFQNAASILPSNNATAQQMFNQLANYKVFSYSPAEILRSSEKQNEQNNILLSTPTDTNQKVNTKLPQPIQKRKQTLSSFGGAAKAGTIAAMAILQQHQAQNPVVQDDHPNTASAVGAFQYSIPHANQTTAGGENSVRLALATSAYREFQNLPGSPTPNHHQILLQQDKSPLAFPTPLNKGNNNVGTFQKSQSRQKSSLNRLQESSSSEMMLQGFASLSENLLKKQEGVAIPHQKQDQFFTLTPMTRNENNNRFGNKDCTIAARQNQTDKKQKKTPNNNTRELEFDEGVARIATENNSSTFLIHSPYRAPMLRSGSLNKRNNQGNTTAYNNYSESNNQNKDQKLTQEEIFAKRAASFRMTNASPDQPQELYKTPRGRQENAIHQQIGSSAKSTKSARSAAKLYK